MLTPNRNKSFLNLLKSWGGFALALTCFLLLITAPLRGASPSRQVAAATCQTDQDWLNTVGRAPQCQGSSEMFPQNIEGAVTDGSPDKCKATAQLSIRINQDTAKFFRRPVEWTRGSAQTTLICHPPSLPPSA